MKTKPPPLTKPAVLFLKDVPGETKNQFKAWCARRGVTMKDAIVKFMRETVSKEGSSAVH